MLLILMALAVDISYCWFIFSSHIGAACRCRHWCHYLLLMAFHLILPLYDIDGWYGWYVPSLFAAAIIFAIQRWLHYAMLKLSPHILALISADGILCVVLSARHSCYYAIRAYATLAIRHFTWLQLRFSFSDICQVTWAALRFRHFSPASATVVRWTCLPCSYMIHIHICCCYYTYYICLRYFYIYTYAMILIYAVHILFAMMSILYTYYYFCLCCWYHAFDIHTYADSYTCHAKNDQQVGLLSIYILLLCYVIVWPIHTYYMSPYTYYYVVILLHIIADIIATYCPYCCYYVTPLMLLHIDYYFSLKDIIH